MTSRAMTCMSGAMSTENTDSQGWQPPGALHTPGSRTSEAQLSEAGIHVVRATSALSFCPISAGRLYQGVPRPKTSHWPL